MNITQHIQQRWQRSNYWQRWLIACGMAALLLGAAWCASWWSNPNKPWLDQPGEGPVAAKALRALAGLPQALEQFRQQHGRYPTGLAQLVPGTLPHLPQTAPAITVSYRPAADGQQFSLSFDYIGPALNECSYAMTTGWQCGGDW